MAQQFQIMNRTNKGVSLLLILGVNMNKLFADIGSRGRFSDFENNNVDNDLFIVTIIIIAIIIMVFYTIVKEKLKGDRENNNKSVENNSTSCPHKEVQIVSGKDSTQRENTVEEESKSFANSNMLDTKMNNWFLAICTYNKWNIEWKKYIITCSKILNFLESTNELKDIQEKSRAAELLINLFLEVTKAEFPQENKKKLIEVLTYDRTCVPDQETFDISDLYDLGSEMKK